jgi:SNF2 family DNA or RNA helicase
MARLEELTVGATVTGILGRQPVTIIAARWIGDLALDVTFRDAEGVNGSQLLYREDEARLTVGEGSLPWSFDADADQMRLASEAYRIRLAHLFDPYLAVHTSQIEPLPHQISAVYQEMLPRMPLRYILADDPGAGKTIMTGLLLKELIIRGDLQRCMIVCPGNLAEQWQDELYRKFGLRFTILTNDLFESAVTGNVFTEVNLCIARLDKLSRNEDLQEKLKVSDWDLIVCDEAHKMSATVWGVEVKYTKRFNLGRLLGQIARHFLLLTATPHNGKEKDFQLFMSLIDPDRFEGVQRSSHQSVDVSDVMRRLVKEELLKFDGKPLFPERRAYTVNYDLSPLEGALYRDVTEYVQEEFNRADNLNKERKNTVGFALTTLQRRLASSPEAIYQSLRRRRERLESRLAEERLGKRAEDIIFDIDDEYDDDDLPQDELENAEEQVIDQATAASTIKELEAEIAILRRLEQQANQVRTSGEDRKWDELSKLLQDNEHMYAEGGSREKLIIFTEHRDTLRYLTNKIRSLLGQEEAVVNIHGGMLRDERRKVEEQFKQDKDVRILVATDAAGEGINLQRANLMINYDLPWNPNRLEQRFGRIHRIGQTEVCHLWNLVAVETREGMVYQRLLEKLEQERETLKGKVFDILGKLRFDNKSLRELLIEAIRHNNSKEARDYLNRVVDNSVNREVLEGLLDEHALTSEIMDASRVDEIRLDMERMEAHKLQPHFIESFFKAAFKNFGGRLYPREDGRFEITTVPYELRNRDRIIGFGEPIGKKYERVCFEKALCHLPGKPVADLLVPGHPLLNATLDLVREQNAGLMKQGTIFVDRNDPGTDLRLLCYIEDAVQDGTMLANGQKRVISKNLHFVEMKADGTATNAGYAPYLDYQAPTGEELTFVRQHLAGQDWLTGDVESLAMNHAILHIVPQHLNRVRARKHRLVDKTAKAVKDRLTSEIQYWDYRASELAEQEAAGKKTMRLSAQQARRRADELAARLQKRLAELEAERMITALPPIITGGAVVVPQGLLHQLMGTVPAAFSSDAQARRQVELAAMEAVMAYERSLGHQPQDVSAQNKGYDIESLVPRELDGDSHPLRLIEVKGRTAGATTVTVTRNEILVGLNTPGYLLALVEVDGGQTKLNYVPHPFKEDLDFAVTSVTFDIAKLLNNTTS